MVTGPEQHDADGIDFGVAPETIQERQKMWSNVRSDLRKFIQQKYAESLESFEGKTYTHESNLRVREEVRRRLRDGEYKDLREKVMYESWDLLETALDVEKMTPFAVEKMLDQFVERAEKSESPAERDIREHKKKIELAKRADEAFAKLPEDLSPQEERDFADWVTKKMNANEELPDDAQKRLDMYHQETAREKESAA